MPIFEYKCDNGHVFDVLVRDMPKEYELCKLCIQKHAEESKEGSVPMCVHPLMARLQISVPSRFVWGKGGGFN